LSLFVIDFFIIEGINEENFLCNNKIKIEKKIWRKRREREIYILILHLSLVGFSFFRSKQQQKAG